MAEKSSKKTTTPKKKSVAAPRRTASAAPKPYKSNKPLISTGTIVTLVTFLLVIAVAVYMGKKKETDAATATPVGGQPVSVFTADEGNPTSIKIAPVEGEAVEISLDDKKAWALTLPTKTEANQGAAEAAATQLSALTIDREISGALDIFGLDKPAYIITVKFSNGKIHTLEIGDSTPTNSGYYARLDQAKMMIISLSGIDALTQMVSAPPYLNTPTPTALPATETPVPASETPDTSSTDVTVTPTP